MKLKFKNTDPSVIADVRIIRVTASSSITPDDEAVWQKMDTDGNEFGIRLAPEPEPVTEGLRGLRMRFPNVGTMKCVGAVIKYSTADGEVGGAVVHDDAKVNSANLNLLMTNIDQSILDDTFIQLNMTYGVTNIIEVLRMTREREVETVNRASSTTKHVQNFTCNRAVFLNDQAELVFVDNPPIELIDYRTDTLESANTNDGISWSFLMSASYSIKALTDNGWEYIVNHGYINPSISPNEFKGNATFKEIYVHDSIVNVGESAFFGLVNLTYIRFPWLCDIVGHSALRNNTQLLQVDFGERVSVFAENSLFYCPVLEKITLPVVTTIPIVADQAFLLNDATIYVKAERVAEFKASSYWSGLASRITAILD